MLIENLKEIQIKVKMQIQLSDLAKMNNKNKAFDLI